MNRVGAFLVHLGISLVIFAVLAWIVLYVWYPGFFFQSDGGWQGIRIIALVDLVLGPTLTLIVFNRKKPLGELRRDLAIIGVIQASCLVAGTYVVFSERPLALVYVDGRFYSMSADDYRDVGLAVPDLTELPGPSPKQVAVEIPADYAAQSEVRQEALQQRIPLRALSSRYVPLTFDRLNAAREALSEEWLTARESETGDLTRWLDEQEGDLDDYAFFTFGARYALLVLGVSRHEGEVVGLLQTPLRLPESSEQAAPS